MGSTEAPDAPSSGAATAGQAAGIVAMGASAGGLPALSEFLAHAPPDSGLAWVVVQHLDPTRSSSMVRLLQRKTVMSVREAVQQVRVERDTVYVMPPNTTLTLLDGHLHLAVPGEPRGLRHPINDMFSSMAHVLGARAVGVLLSGTGSDGTEGLRAIRNAGGLAAAQTPDTAQFDGMVLSAIDAGCVDMIAPCAALPRKILETLAARPVHSGPSGDGVPMADPLILPAQRLAAVLNLLKARGRHDFSNYKRSTLLRRIERRMGIHHVASIDEYVRLLEANEAELDLLGKELLIGVTTFFRDTAVWLALKQQQLPALLAARGDGWHMRAWVAGCSTGEEAYSLAITFRELVQSTPAHANCTLQVFATDLSADAIDRARRGWYPASIGGEVSAQRLARFFTPQAGSWRIANEIREMVVFATHDINVDPPFTRLDLLSCRNLLIYLTAPLQRRLIPLFHYSLRAQGVLLLGSSETVGRYDDLFETLDARLRLYRCRVLAHPAPAPDFAMRAVPSDVEPVSMEIAVSEEPAPLPPNLQFLADRYLLQHWAPPAVVVNDRGDIVYINGRTGRFLEPAAGKANWNVHVMAREGLRSALDSALRHAGEQPGPVEVLGVPLDNPADPPAVDLVVRALDDMPGLNGMLLIVFRDPRLGAVQPRPRRRTTAAVHHELEAELQRAREDAQSLREEMRASQEELQAANEELQSTNEELQSTNEELTSSKEEMQAMNEELQAVNAELQAKLDDLAIAQSDMRNLLNSTDIATLFLDKSLNVRRFTERARKVISLRDGDVGRPLGDLTTSLDYPAMEEDVRDMLRTLVVSEKQVCSRQGHWYTVKIMPYRTQDDVIEGAVVTFVDTSTARAAGMDAGQGAPPSA